MLVDVNTGKYLRDGTDFVYWDNSTRSAARISATTGAEYKGDPDISSTERTVSIAGVSYKCRTTFHYLREEIFSYSLQQAAQITGVPRAKIESFAREYATHKPCGIRMGQGMQRYNYAYQGFRSVATLAALCGQIGIVGGGATHMGGALPIFTGDNAANEAWQNASTWNANRPDSKRTEMRGIELYYTVDNKPSGLPKALDYTPDTPNMLWVVCSALVNQSPDFNRLTKEVLPKIPFVVNQDPFFNATSPYCDLLLPTKSYWENWDFVVRTPWILLQKPAIAPIGESLSDVEIYSGIAKVLGEGYQEYWDRSDKQFVMDRFVDKDTKPGLAGFNWDEFEKTGIWTIQGADFSPVHTDFNFANTMTKKFEFYTEVIADTANALSKEDRRQKVPAFGKPYEDPNDTSTGALARKYPLVFIQYHDRQSAHTQNLLAPALRAVAKEPFIEINDEDAKARDIKHGDIVRVFNDRGEVVVKAHVTPGILKGSTAIPAGWAPEHFIKGHYQELTHCKLNAVEHLLFESNFAAYDNLVQIEIYKG
jgi:molybdopterin-containing oxidoreductase family molybdopterin binding subunit